MRGFKSPVFAMVVPRKMPRLTSGATVDCNCYVPWDERPPWDKPLHAQYELPLATSPWQSHSAACGNFWRAIGIDSDTELADELIGVEACSDACALLSHCEALQTVLSGGGMSMVIHAGVEQHAQKNGMAKDQAETTGVDAPTLGSAAADQNGNCLAGCPPEKEEEVQSWSSGDSEDTAASETGDSGDMETETSKEEAESASMQGDGQNVVRSEGEQEEQEQSSFEADGEDDGLDWSAESVPATPPRRHWQRQGHAGERT